MPLRIAPKRHFCFTGLIAAERAANPVAAAIGIDWLCVRRAELS
jgi:hypothetical protein